MRVLVLGAGISGRAAAALAGRRGDTVTVYDGDSALAQSLPGVSVVTGVWGRDLLEGIELVVASPGIPERSQPIVDALEARLPVVSEIEYASSSIHAPVIAVTGTNGKTTVTQLITDMLIASGRRAVAAGNIGTALSDVADEDWDVFVVEVSSFQLRFIDGFHPETAIVLNVAEDHLDWHGSADAYRLAKARIVENQTAKDLVIFDADDPGATAAVASALSEKSPISGVSQPEGGAGPVDGRLAVGGLSFDLAALQVSDPVFIADLTAAAVAALTFGAEGDAVGEVMTSFVPNNHRRSTVEIIEGVTWVNDSKATNPHAAIASINAFGSVILIAGGLAKQIDLTPMLKPASLRHLIALGESAPTLVKAAERFGVSHSVVTSMAEAVAQASSFAEEGDTVLLAPGCASFDMFASYEERGSVFEELVTELGGSR